MNALVRCRTVERRDARAIDVLIRPDAPDRRDGPDAPDRPDGPGGRDSVDDAITLDETDRHRRRFALVSDRGIGFLLDLEHATLLRDGDVLALEDGRRVVVRAAPEPLYEVRGHDPRHLLTLAWHIGNRHLPTQVMVDHLRVRVDPVIGNMLAGLGADVQEIAAGFDPEGGAYDASMASSTDPLAHLHRHEHGHQHEHEREQQHAREQDHGHENGQGHESEHDRG